MNSGVGGKVAYEMYCCWTVSVNRRLYPKLLSTCKQNGNQILSLWSTFLNFLSPWLFSCVFILVLICYSFTVSSTIIHFLIRYGSSYFYFKLMIIYFSMLPSIRFQGGATHVDIAYDAELVKLAISLTSLPVS